jgi:hypothetical protein
VAAAAPAYALVIGVDPFASPISDVDFDAIYTVEDTGSYKPSDRNFDDMLEKLGTIGVEKEQTPQRQEAWSMITLPPTATAWHPAGSIVGTQIRASAPRCTPATCRRWTSASTAWPTSRRRT